MKAGCSARSPDHSRRALGSDSPACWGHCRYTEVSGSRAYGQASAGADAMVTPSRPRRRATGAQRPPTAISIGDSACSAVSAVEKLFGHAQTCTLSPLWV